MSYIYYIYVASPYSHPDPDIREKRFLAVRSYVGKMLKDGVPVFSPIVHCHQIALDFGLPTDASFWRNYAAAMLRNASYLHVLTLPGWEESIGVAYEIGLAHAWNKDVIFR
jgi:hypothetical protein